MCFFHAFIDTAPRRTRSREHPVWRYFVPAGVGGRVESRVSDFGVFILPVPIEVNHVAYAVTGDQRQFVISDRRVYQLIFFEYDRRRDFAKDVKIIFACDGQRVISDPIVGFPRQFIGAQASITRFVQRNLQLAGAVGGRGRRGEQSQCHHGAEQDVQNSFNHKTSLLFDFIQTHSITCLLQACFSQKQQRKHREREYRTQYQDNMLLFFGVFISPEFFHIDHRVHSPVLSRTKQPFCSLLIQERMVVYTFPEHPRISSRNIRKHHKKP